MVNQSELLRAAAKADPVVAATLTGIIYQARLFNRQARVSVPEEKIVAEVLGLWRTVMDALNSESAAEPSA